MTNSGDPAPLLILNIDYAGRCAGSCPVCALSLSERESVTAFLTPDQVAAGLAQVHRRGHQQMETLVIGVGRGNMLALGDGIADDLLAIARAARAQFAFRDGLMEIATSVMGRLEDQIRRAHHILDRFADADTGMDSRFVVVANAALDSPRYWAHLRAFLDDLMARRGGADQDGSGDVLVLNLALGALPEIGFLIDQLGHYKFPVNVTWAPTLDPNARDPAHIRALEDWLDRWHRAMQHAGMDGSLVTRAAEGHRHRNSDRDTLKAKMAGNGAVLFFIDRTGTLHQGFSSVSADMDPVRFASGIGDAGGGLRMMESPDHELAHLLRWPACRGCAQLAGCIISGAHKSALLTIPRLSGQPVDPQLCPSGMRQLLAGYVSSSKSF